MHAHVDVCEAVDLGPDACWAILRLFCHPWHPAIDQMHAEEGGAVRVFTVHGENRRYKERLTWFSDSDRTLKYTHLQGIVGAVRYDATLSVSMGAHGGSMVRWQAEIEAAPDRSAGIAEGTEAIFRSGIEALKTMAPPQSHPFQTATDGSICAVMDLSTTPALSVLGTPEAEGPLCLFLHGIGGQKENWTAQLDAVGRGAAALDLRGYGGSALGPDPSTVEDYCEDIIAVCDAFGARPLVLCGLSYGAWIATSFAMRQPDLLAGLVLAGGCTGMSEAPQEARRAFRESREVPLTQGRTPADFAPGVVDVIAGPDATPEVRAVLTASMAAIPSDTYRDALQCFTNPRERFDFSRLTMPVLMMTGAHDRLAPPSEIRSVARRIWTDALRPNVRFEEIAGAGHVCNLEQPEAFNQILLDFLSQVTA